MLGQQAQRIRRVPGMVKRYGQRSRQRRREKREEAAAAAAASAPEQESFADSPGDSQDSMKPLRHRHKYDPRRWAIKHYTESGSGPPEGYLLIWVGMFKRWQKRFCVADRPGVLIYYKHKSKKGTCWTINLQEATVSDSDANERQFVINNGATTYFFRSFSKEQREPWIACLRESIRTFADVIVKAKEVKANALWPRHADGTLSETDEEEEDFQKELQARCEAHKKVFEPDMRAFLGEIRRLQQSLATMVGALDMGEGAETELQEPVSPATSVGVESGTPSRPSSPLHPASPLASPKQPISPLGSEAKSDSQQTPKLGTPMRATPQGGTPSKGKFTLFSVLRDSNDSPRTVQSKLAAAAVDAVAEQPSQMHTAESMGSIAVRRKGWLMDAWKRVQEAYDDQIRSEVRRCLLVETENAALQKRIRSLEQQNAALLSLHPNSHGSTRSMQPIPTVEVPPAEDEDADSNVSSDEASSEATNGSEEYFEALEALNQYEYYVKTTPADRQLATSASSLRLMELAPKDTEPDLASEESSDEGDGVRQPRTRLPAPRPLNRGFKLWSILKNMIGKDLNAITLPATINEPLSILQRCAEEMEYRWLIDEATKQKTSLLRLLYVTVYAAASYSTANARDGKPFNPLLGETYEWIAPDNSAKFLVEQVSHHPPISAWHGESSSGSWGYYGEVEVKNKFWGKSVEIYPLGSSHLRFPKTGDHFAWSKASAYSLCYAQRRFKKSCDGSCHNTVDLMLGKRVVTCIHNIVFGKLWVDTYGEAIVTNHTTGECAKLRFQQHSRGKRALLSGKIYKADGQAVYSVHGNYEKAIHVVMDGTDKPPPGVPSPVWAIAAYPDDWEQQYNLTRFAITLNELPSTLAPCLPPTDSRFRPDQRGLEDGRLEVATTEKLRLEEKQRQARRERRERGTEYHPRWFKPRTSTPTEVNLKRDGSDPTWCFTNEYWTAREKREWAGCPDIY
eukprot:jgi/Chlat1/4437/Chrsp29S04403